MASITLRSPTCCCLCVQSERGFVRATLRGAWRSRKKGHGRFSRRRLIGRSDLLYTLSPDTHPRDRFVFFTIQAGVASDTDGARCDDWRGEHISWPTGSRPHWRRRQRRKGRKANDIRYLAQNRPQCRLLCDRGIVLKLTQKRKSVSKSVSLMEVGLSELWRCRGTLMTSLIGTD